MSAVPPCCLLVKTPRLNLELQAGRPRVAFQEWSPT